MAYVGCASTSAPKIAAVAAGRPAKNSAIAAGTSSCLDPVPGSESVGYEPPWPGPKQKTASESVSSEAPAQREPKTTAPASHATAQAIGVSSEGS